MKSNRIHVALLTPGLLLGTVAGLEAANAELRQLRSLDELRADFNRDAGRPRVVLLLSPT